MKKTYKFAIAMVTLLALFAVIVPVHADLINREVTYDTGGVLNILGKFKLDSVEVTASAAELNIMEGVTATAEEINTAADPSAGSTTVSVTNGAVFTLSASTPIIRLTGIDGANDTTNTITVATPYPDGVTYTIYVGAGSTNLVLIADDSTVMALGSDWIGDATDTLMIHIADTNKAWKLSSSDN